MGGMSGVEICRSGETALVSVVEDDDDALGWTLGVTGSIDSTPTNPSSMLAPYMSSSHFFKISKGGVSSIEVNGMDVTVGKTSVLTLGLGGMGVEGNSKNGEGAGGILSSTLRSGACTGVVMVP